MPFCKKKKKNYTEKIPKEFNLKKEILQHWSDLLECNVLLCTLQSKKQLKNLRVQMSNEQIIKEYENKRKS